MGGKGCDHQDMCAELMTFEVEIVLLALPHRESEKQHLDNSTTLQPWCAAGRAGHCLLKAQVGT